jgi:hypothetical protein
MAHFHGLWRCIHTHTHTHLYIGKETYKSYSRCWIDKKKRREQYEQYMIDIEEEKSYPRNCVEMLLDGMSSLSSSERNEMREYICPPTVIYRVESITVILCANIYIYIYMYKVIFFLSLSLSFFHPPSRCASLPIIAYMCECVCVQARMRVCVCRESIADIHKAKRTHTYTHIHRDVHGEGAKRLKARKAKPNRAENGTNETRQRDASIGAHGVPFLYLSKK